MAREAASPKMLMRWKLRNRKSSKESEEGGKGGGHMQLSTGGDKEDEHGGGNTTRDAVIKSRKKIILNTNDLIDTKLMDDSSRNADFNHFSFHYQNHIYDKWWQKALKLVEETLPFERSALMDRYTSEQAAGSHFVSHLTQMSTDDLAPLNPKFARKSKGYHGHKYHLTMLKHLMMDENQDAYPDMNLTAKEQGISQSKQSHHRST